MPKKNKVEPEYSYLSPARQLIVASVIFVAAVLASRGATISVVEEALFRAIYDLPDALKPFFLAVTQLGNIYALFALAIVYVFIKKYNIVLRLLMTGSLAYLLSGVAKDLWGRARPHELLVDIISLDYFRGPGFPSGHTALAVALALTLGHYIPRKYHWIVASWILLVGLSRIYLGVHTPLDIVGGFAVGWISYALFRQVRLYDVNKTNKFSDSK